MTALSARPEAMAPLALQGISPAALARELDLTLADARKIVSAVHRAGQGDMAIGPRTYFPQVKRESVERVRERGHVPMLELLREEKSSVDPFRKFLLAAPDGHKIETVRIPLERAGRFSVCVSSQVGCALACAFCATGRLGLLRNLETWEIVEQVRVVRRSLGEGEKVHGIVFQGMGEPLANFDRVDSCPLRSERAGHRCAWHDRLHLWFADGHSALGARASQGASRPFVGKCPCDDAAFIDAHSSGASFDGGHRCLCGAHDNDGARAHVGGDLACRRERR